MSNLIIGDFFDVRKIPLGRGKSFFGCFFPLWSTKRSPNIYFEVFGGSGRIDSYNPTGPEHMSHKRYVLKSHFSRVIGTATRYYIILCRKIEFHQIKTYEIHLHLYKCI